MRSKFLFWAAAALVVSIIPISVFTARLSDRIFQNFPMGQVSGVIELNSGFFLLDGWGLQPRNHRLLIAEVPSGVRQVAYASRSDSFIGIFDLESGETVVSRSFSELGLASALQEPEREVFVFDLESANSFVYMSLVTTDREADTCDSYSIVRSRIEGDNELGQFEFVWKSPICRSVVDPHYGWPDFTGRMEIVENTLYLTSGLSSMNMIQEVFPEPGMERLADSLAEELYNNELFGSITAINLVSQESQVFAKGFRSPAGITAGKHFGSSSPRIWVSEHGSRGGDELNLVRPGGNYGWPFVSLGFSYNLADNPSVPTKFGTHDGFDEPVFTWTPSIAPSQIHAIQGAGFASLDWQDGDLVLGTLKDKSLHLLKTGPSGSVVSDTRVYLGHRIRDIAQIDAELVLSTDDGMIMSLRVLDDSNSPDQTGMYPPISPDSWLDAPMFRPFAYASDVLLDILTP